MPDRVVPDQPLLVFGPRSLDYDFGPTHPLTPRRFGPGIDLLRALGAEPGLAPEPASDDELLWAHTAAYLEVVKRFSVLDQGWMEAEAGIGSGGDDPPFVGMHDAAAAVAGGSIRAMEAILRGDVEHAFHPGGGLHHAMPNRPRGSASTTIPPSRSPERDSTDCGSCTSTSTSITATGSRRSMRPIRAS
jgi:acetoin utilization protein AcuC